MQDDYLKLFNKNLNYFTILLDKSQDVFWITNNDYTVQIYVSPAFNEIWGYDVAMLYKNPLFWLETIDAQDKHRLASISRLPHSCVMSYYREQYRIVRANGEERWILDHTFPILNEIGQCIGYAGIAKDITATLRLQRDFQIANQFLPKLAEKMERSAFWVRDPTLTKQLYLSKGFERIWGRSQEFLYSHPDKWGETIVPEDRKDLGVMLATLEDRGPETPYIDLYRVKRPTGEVRWIRDISFPIYDDNTQHCIGFAGIAEDITQEKLYEIELQEAKNRAEEANIAKSNFLASISHDFRTPLNGLLGMAEILRSGRCYPEQKEYIDAILQAGETLLDLVEDVINFVALDLNKLPISLDWLDLGKLIEEIILTVSPLAQDKKIEILFRYSEMVPLEIYGDAGRIRRILMNLVNNAVKFTNKGHVLINVELHKKTKKKMWLKFMVEDTGIGISKDRFEYIFGSFNRVELSYTGKYKGTGLGLTIVKQFVKDLGGTINLKSQLNVGSVFSCNIPFNLETKKEENKVAKIYSKVKVLIIDDSLKRAEQFIKQVGLKNGHAASSVDALTIVHQAGHKDSFSLILIDDEIQENVSKLAKILKKEAAYGMVVLLAGDKYGKKALDTYKALGFDDCLIKPVELAKFQQVIENALLKLEKQANEMVTTERKVLLVEDDLLTQKITRWMLEELNWRVEVAGDGAQALELLEKSYDLIIMDVGLPDIDGIELAKKIRQTLPLHKNTAIVALTAHVMDHDKEKCLNVGMNDFLKKPLFKKDLKKLLFNLFIN